MALWWEEESFTKRGNWNIVTAVGYSEAQAWNVIKVTKVLHKFIWIMEVVTQKSSNDGESWLVGVLARNLQDICFNELISCYMWFPLSCCQIIIWNIYKYI